MELYILSKALDFKSSVLFFEEWDRVEDYEAYLTWRETGVMERLGSVFVSAPAILYFDEVEI